MKRMRPFYLRLVVVAVCAGALTVQANTYGDVYHRSWLVHPNMPPACTHGTVPDLNPHSPNYGGTECAR